MAARHRAGAASNPSFPPMGARFRLKSTYDISRFTAQAQVILLAMQHYGLILADNGGNWFFSGTQDARWADSLLTELKSIAASQFEAVDESGLMVDVNSAPTRYCGSGATTGTSVRPGLRLYPVLCSVPGFSRKGTGWPAVRTATPRRPRWSGSAKQRVDGRLAAARDRLGILSPVHRIEGLEAPRSRVFPGL